MNHSEMRKFYKLSFFLKRSDLGFMSNKVFFLQFLVDFLPLRFGSVDPHIFAGPIQEAKILRIQQIRIRILSTD